MKNKIVSKTLAAVLSAATLTGSVVSGGAEVKAYSPQVVSYNNAGLSSSKKILLGVGAASTAVIGTLLIVGGALAYNEHRHWKSRCAHEWVKLKNLTNTEFANKIDDAIKLIDKIVASENDGSYNANESKWTMEVTTFEGVFCDFLNKIIVIRNIVRGQKLSGDYLTAFTPLNKLVEDYCFKNNLGNNFLHVRMNLANNYEGGAISDAKKLQTNLANFKTDFENLKDALYKL